MKISCTWFLVVVFGCALFTLHGLQAQDKSKPAKQDSEKDCEVSIAGTWTVKSGERAGESVDEERFPESITISDKAITIPTPGGNFVMAYEIVSQESPFHVDMEITEGPGEGTALGIIKIEDGTLSLCYDPTGENRPEAFETDEENGFFMFVMKKAVARLDPAKLVGNWKCVSGKRAGEDIPAERMGDSITFSKDSITIPAGPDMTFEMSYTVNTEKTPATIDMKIEAGPGEGGQALGIVKIEDGKFWLCYHPMGEERPEAFESTEENGCFLFEMKPADD